MRSNTDAVEHFRHGDSRITPNSSRGPENEEWAWMVDEDPAFYLTKSGRAPESTGR